MLSEKARKGDIQIEISQGLAGNKFETDVPIGSSTTIGTRAVYDRQNYHYLAWENKKPCLELQTTWEDCDYRYVLRLELNLQRAQEYFVCSVGYSSIRTNLPCRMETLNTLLSTAKILEPIIQAFDDLKLVSKQSQRQKRELYASTQRALNVYIRACERPLPELPIGLFTR